MKSQYEIWFYASKVNLSKIWQYFGRQDKNTDLKKVFSQCIQCQVEEGCLWMKCLVFRLSNLSPDLCCSLVLFVSASISLSLSYLNVVFSMCCPVMHRSPTLALAPFICAEKDRWRRGLGSLSARCDITGFGVETGGPRPCAANRSLHNNKTPNDGLKIHIALLLLWQFHYNDKNRGNYTDVGMFVHWNCFVTVQEYMSWRFQGKSAWIAYENNTRMTFFWNVCWNFYILLNPVLFFNFTFQKSSRNYSYVIWNYNVDPWIIRATMVPVLQLNESRRVRCRCCCCCCFLLVSRCILVHVVLKYFVLLWNYFYLLIMRIKHILSSYKMFRCSGKGELRKKKN